MARNTDTFVEKTIESPVIETTNTGRARLMNLSGTEFTVPLINGVPLKVGIGVHNISDEFEKKDMPKTYIKRLLHEKIVKYV
jgi:hypothetical protein